MLMGFRDDYGKALVKKYQLPAGWIVNWTPGTDVAVGMVGRFEDGSFRRDGWLHDPSRGVAWEKDPYAGPPDGPWSFQTEKSVTIDARARVGSDPAWSFVGQARAGVKFSFAQGGGMILATTASHEEHIADLKALREGLLAAHADGNRMRERDVVVTAVRAATSGFVLIAHKSGGEVQATTNADLTVPGMPSMAQLAASIEFSPQSSAATAHAYPDGFVIAFQAIELLPRYWRWLPKMWRFGHIETEFTRSEPDDVFLELPR
jgi:hypothetical protein